MRWDGVSSELRAAGGIGFWRRARRAGGRGNGVSGGDFDWSPWLQDGEDLLWSAKPHMLPLWVMGISAMTIIIGVILGVHDGSAKANAFVAIAPWFGSFLAILMLATLFVRNRYCLTNRRLMTLRFAPWRRTPKLSAIETADADLQVEPRRPLIVRSRKTRKQILSMILSKTDEVSLLNLVKQEHP